MPNRPARAGHRLTGLLCLAALLFTGTTHAHQRSESFSRWQWDGGNLEMQFTVSAREATRLPPAPGAASPGQALADYLAARIAPDGSPDAPGCRLARPLQPVAARPGYLRVAGRWACDQAPSGLVIDAFFDLAAEHTHFASLETSQGLRQSLLTRERRDWPLDAGTAEPSAQSGPGAVFRAWLDRGVQHIASGPDHVVFLLALLLLCRRPRDVVWAVTGFTVGHSITLSLAVFGLVQPVVPAIEAVIGLSIALVVVERAARWGDSALPLASVCAAGLLALAAFWGALGSGPGTQLLAGLALFTFCYLLLAHEYAASSGVRMLMTGLFGLVHGFGFAGAFLAGGLEGAAVLPALAGFNLGVELGQLALVFLALGLGWLLRRSPRLYLPLREVCAAAICGLGVFWFVQRGMF